MLGDFVGKYIGVLGGGQLGKMMVLEAHRLGMKVCVLDPTKECPCSGMVDKQLVGDFKDPQQVMRLLNEGCEVVTVEIEHVNVDSLDALVEAGIKVQPMPSTLRIIQDKLVQKRHLEKHKVAVAPYKEVNTKDDVLKCIENYGLPVLLKSRKLAYDGRGNYVVHNLQDVDSAWETLGGSCLYVEKWVEFEKELAVMVARSLDGTLVTYPVVETIHRENICHTVIAPAQINQNVKNSAEQIAKMAIGCFEGAGIFGVELFMKANGEVLVNEIAPRPHNSGHYTIEACSTSQFEQHVRAILGLPLGDTSMIVGASMMVNILGTSEGEAGMVQTLAPVCRAMGTRGSTVHWYGKREVKKNRKMGHVTVVGESIREVGARMLQLGVEDAPAMVPLVGIIMGSDSDLPKMKAAAEMLQNFGISFELTIVSAHRTPDRMFEYAKNAHLRGLRVIIAGAGGAAHLPGMVASLTPLPVIGVPIRIEPMDGTDALFSIVQMPRGVPVATVAINNSTNAGLLAARIIGCTNHEILTKMIHYQEQMRDDVLAKVDKLESVGWKKYT